MYTSPKEVEVVRHADLIAEAYEQAFKIRYGTIPFIEKDDAQVFSFLSKNFGLDRGKAIVAFYVSMNDDWFIKHAHNAATLRKNVQKVVADLGVREMRATQGVGLKIEITAYCDFAGCFKPFAWVGDPRGLDSGPRYCPEHSHG